MELDQILAARAPLYLYQQTKEDKYKIVSESFIAQLEKHPRTSDGGYWHKQVYEWQMWLDGIYMADVFKMQYAAMFDKPKITDDAIHQITLIYKHTHDPKTGLMFHGWDEHKNKVWADQTTGCSPEVWARGLGWYMMALVDVLDYIPANHPQRDSVLQILNSLSVNLAKYQNTEGLWYQVVDKGDRPDNWVETSATAMYAYAYAKGAKKGYLPKEYFEKAAKAFEGMRKSYLFFDDSGKLHMLGTVKVGTLNFKFSDGSYKYYINVDRRIDDFKGIGALLYLAIELSN